MRNLRGRIIGPSGPLTGAIVLVQSAAGASRDVAAVTGEDGRFQLAALPVGSCVLGVTVGDGPPIPVPIEIEQGSGGDGGAIAVEIRVSPNAPPLITRVHDQSEENKR